MKNILTMMVLLAGLSGCQYELQNGDEVGSAFTPLPVGGYAKVGGRSICQYAAPNTDGIYALVADVATSSTTSTSLFGGLTVFPWNNSVGAIVQGHLWAPIDGFLRTYVIFAEVDGTCPILLADSDSRVIDYTWDTGSNIYGCYVNASNDYQAFLAACPVSGDAPVIEVLADDSAWNWASPANIAAGPFPEFTACTYPQNGSYVCQRGDYPNTCHYTADAGECFGEGSHTLCFAGCGSILSTADTAVHGTSNGGCPAGSTPVGSAPGSMCNGGQLNNGFPAGYNG